MSPLLGVITLGFLLLLLLGRMLTVWKLRSLDQEYRANQNRIAELGEDLDTSRRKYLIVLKAEGVAKQDASQDKARLASLKQHLEQLEKTAVQQEAQKQKTVEKKLEGLVMNALGGTSVRRDSQFKRVMKVIHQLINLEKESKNEDLIAAIQEKIDGLGREGLIEAADRGRVAASAGSEVADESGEVEVLEPSADEVADDDGVLEPTPGGGASDKAGEVEVSGVGVDRDDVDSKPAETDSAKAAQQGMGRRDRIRGAITRKRS